MSSVSAFVKNHPQLVLETKDYARGDARLILRVRVEVCKQIIKLDWAQRNEGQNFQVESAADGGGKRVLRETCGNQRADARTD